MNDVAGPRCGAYIEVMSSAEKRRPISEEDYLAGELNSPVKHEYVAGEVYAMTGGRNGHNEIAGNIFAKLHARLAGKRCRPYNSDTKVRIRYPTHVRYYYPDVSVTCRPNPPSDSFQDHPTVVVEVLSPSTRRADQGEKREAYCRIPSLAAYLLVEQDGPSVVVYRRSGDDFVRESYDGQAAVVPLPEIETELPLAEIYDRVVFVPEEEPTE